MTNVIHVNSDPDTNPVTIGGVFYTSKLKELYMASHHGQFAPKSTSFDHLTGGYPFQDQLNCLNLNEMLLGPFPTRRSKSQKVDKLGIRAIAAAAIFAAPVYASGELPSQPINEIAFPRPTNRIANHEANQWKSLEEKMESFLELADGWNGYSAPAPNERAVENALSFLNVLHYYDHLPSRVVTSAVGGVAITRRIGAKKVCIEFFNNGLISALFADDETETMHTRQFNNFLNAYDDAVSEIEDYLNG